MSIEPQQSGVGQTGGAVTGLHFRSAVSAPNPFPYTVYTLPVYHFVPHFRRLTDDWKLAGITTFQSGFPILVATGSYQPANNIGGVVSDINDPRFGRLISASAGRIVPLAGKLYF